MTSLKYKLKKIYNWVYLPFLVLFIGMLIYHFFLKTNFGDDVQFKKILQNNNIIDWLKLRYRTWSSRLIIEYVMVNLLHYAMFMWKILDVLIITLLGISISKLFVDSDIRNNNWVIVGLIFLYPFVDMSTAGWIATTLNYLWPLSFGLYSFVIIKKILNGNKVKGYEYISSTLALIFAVNQEQMCAIALAIYCLLSVYSILKNKPKTYIFIQTFLCLGSFIFILTTPGNAIRKAKEIITWFPDYNMLTLMNKLEIGFSSSLEKFIFKPNMIFIVFSIVIAMATILKYEDEILRLISLVPFIGCLIFPSIPRFSGATTEYGIITIDNFYSLKSYIPIIVLGIVGICSILALYFCFGNTFKSILSISILLLGFSSRIIMAFSPTIWASSDRTYIFMYFSIIICSVMVCNEISKIKYKNYRLINYIIGMLSIVYYGNNIIGKV